MVKWYRGAFTWLIRGFDSLYSYQDFQSISLVAKAPL